MTNQEVLLEQYKLFVKTADDITSRRLEVNKFYLTLLLGIFTISGFLNTKQISVFIDTYIVLMILSILGFFLTVIWYMNIESYKLLNLAKFKVIHEMEKDLVYQCFSKEWQFRKGCEPSKAYPRFTQLEKYLPIIMGILYLVLFIVLLLDRAFR